MLTVCSVFLQPTAGRTVGQVKGCRLFTAVINRVIYGKQIRTRKGFPQALRFSTVSVIPPLLLHQIRSTNIDASLETVVEENTKKRGNVHINASA
jgi:hypothetical protein